MSYSPERVEEALRKLIAFTNGICTNAEAGRECLGFVGMYGEYLAATLRQQAARALMCSGASLAEQGTELASDMAYEANQQNSQELADRAALVQRLAIALSAQPAERQGEAVAYFAADPAEGEFNKYKTLAEALAGAESLLESAQDEASDYGWQDEPPQICYGVVLGKCVELEGSRRPAPEGSEFTYLVDYRLTSPSEGDVPPFTILLGACKISGRKADVMHIAQIIGEQGGTQGREVLRDLERAIGLNASGASIDHDKRPSEYKEGLVKAYGHCLEMVRRRLAATTHPAAPVGLPDESIEENGKWYVLMDGARYEVSQIEAEGWDYCVSYLQKLNAAAPSAPQGNAGLGIPSCGKPLCSENDHHPLCPSAPQGEGSARERLEDERWRLMNSFGNGPVADGQTRDRIAEIDAQLATNQPMERK